MSLYQELTSEKDIDQVILESRDRPVLIFKHSTLCPISARAHTAYCDFAENNEKESIPCYLVNVIEERALSKLIAEKLSVEHHSPQAILVHNEKPVWVATHRNITQDSLAEACRKIRTDG